MTCGCRSEPDEIDALITEALDLNDWSPLKTRWRHLNSTIDALAATAFQLENDREYNAQLVQERSILLMDTQREVDRLTTELQSKHRWNERLRSALEKCSDQLKASRTQKEDR